MGGKGNLDLRREFHAHLEATSIAATTIFNGASAELLLGPMPLLVPRLRRVVNWGDADQRLDFTTKDDTAAFTARVALDPLDNGRYPELGWTSVRELLAAG